MRILYIRPVADSSHAMDISAVLQEAARSDTTVDVVSLSKDRPRHLEYHAYEAIAVADIVKHVRAAANKYDAQICYTSYAANICYKIGCKHLLLIFDANRCSKICYDMFG